MTTPYTLDAASAAAVADHMADLRMAGATMKTIAGRTGALRVLARSLGKPLLEMTEADLRRWQRGMAGGADRAELCVRTRRVYVSHARMFFRWAQTEGLIDADPSTVLIMPKPPRGRPRPIQENTLQQALAAADPMVRAWLVLAAGAGLRAMEIAGLCRDDVIDRSDEPHLIVRGKGDKVRTVPLAGWVLTELRAYGMPVSGPLFRKQNGQPLDPHYVSAIANRRLHAGGVPETLHQLRHRFATRLHRATRDIRLVQELMGHESLATTANYVAYDAAEAAAGVDALTVGAA